MNTVRRRRGVEDVSVVTCWRACISDDQNDRRRIAARRQIALLNQRDVVWIRVLIRADLPTKIRVRRVRRDHRVEVGEESGERRRSLRRTVRLIPRESRSHD